MSAELVRKYLYPHSAEPGADASGHDITEPTVRLSGHSQRPGLGADDRGAEVGQGVTAPETFCRPDTCTLCEMTTKPKSSA